MPIVASMGGNAGMQTLAVTVRTLATNDLTKNNFSQNILKEFNIGILNGIIFAIISASSSSNLVSRLFTFYDYIYVNDCDNDSGWIIWNCCSNNFKKNGY